MRGTALHIERSGNFDAQDYAGMPSFDLRFPNQWNPATGVLTPHTVVDNSGAALPNPINIYSMPLSTGAVGANKTQEFAVSLLPTGGTAPQDILASVNDATTHGFWRRMLVFDALVIPRSTAGPLSVTSRVGIGLGSYGVVPPDPATTTLNVVRLCTNWFVPNWELITHKGDGAAAQVVTTCNLGPVPTPVNGRAFKLRLTYRSDGLIRAFVNGVLGAQVNQPMQIPPGAGVWHSALTYFVTSGTGAANVRAWFGPSRLRVFGL